MSAALYSEWSGVSAVSQRVAPERHPLGNYRGQSNEIDLPLVRALFAAASDLSPAELDALAMLFRDRARDLRTEAVVEMRRAA